MKAKVTIIVPIYNVEKYIEKCLKSLIKQTYKNIEIWAIDDGSPDNSKDIVKEMSKLDSRIKLMEKSNGGYGSVLQYAIQNIKTEYFIICDPDDWLSNDAVERLYATANEDNLDLVVADRINVYGDKNNSKYIHVVPTKIGIKSNKVYTLTEDIQKFSFSEPSPHAKLYRTEIARNINFPTKISYTDFVLYILFLAKASRVEYIQNALAFYYFDRPGNTATDYREDIVNDYLIIWKSIILQLKKVNISNLNVLYFRMYEQLKYTLYKYALSSKNPFHDKYTNKIYGMITQMQSLNITMPKYNWFSLKDKIVFKGFMNKNTGKVCARALVKKYQNKLK